ncbi:hypothetical protein [Haloferula sp.]
MPKLEIGKAQLLRWWLDVLLNYIEKSDGKLMLPLEFGESKEDA